MEQENIYIVALKFGQQNLGIGVKFGQLKEHLKEQGFSYANEEEEKQWRRLFYKVFNDYESGLTARLDSEDSSEETEGFFDIESYSRLIEHEELRLARESATGAKKQSTNAIVISVLALFASVLIGLWQLNSETNLSEDSYKPVQNSISSWRFR